MRETLAYGVASSVMQNELVKRLAWSGLVAGLSLLASLVAERGARLAWRRITGEDPPE